MHPIKSLIRFFHSRFHRGIGFDVWWTLIANQRQLGVRGPPHQLTLVGQPTL
jgi:hypothetical protein